ncbi:MAG: endopeptidase La [Chloroflexi bacterium RBG_16_47_49]|nr:MAG: endopeptidase La [Chloroflexi bacterium RBG_16_47_49]
MKESDWYYHDDDDDFGEAVHRRTEELYKVPEASTDPDGLIECPVLPLRDLVIFPHMVAPVFVGREASLLAIEEAQMDNRTMIALSQRDSAIDNPRVTDFLSIGVEVAVGRLVSMPDGSSSALAQGRRRLEVVEFTQREPFMVARARPLSETARLDREIDATMRTALELFQKCVQLNRSLPDEAYLYALNIEEPGWLADMIVTTVAPPMETRLKLLQVLNPSERLKEVLALLAQEVDVLELEDQIHTRAQSEVDRSQREFYLREQLRIIQTELGESDPWLREISDLRKQVEGISLPEEVMLRALKEIDRLNQMPPMSPEVGIIRTYIDWILDLPWTNTTEDNLNVPHAAETLEKYHYGLPRAKDRILEYIAVRSLKPKRTKQPILCFVGPPGTGKTSLGRSIADALGRKFVRLSLGGVRDEAEIRGHRRTYIGALPGRILQTMRRAGTINPLFMLDEVDKLGQDFRGDPSSALLEVLDPEQNHAFSDHYLELAYDLSKVMFITTANYTGPIPSALLDRMEVIEFPGYIEEEKLEIARRFLLPRQLEEAGLDEDKLRFQDQALKRIIREYTYEAGVRNFEREIGMVCRKIARIKAEGKSHPTRVTPTAMERFLGPPQFFNLEAERKDEVGVATAIAWTENGGEIMPVEVLLMDGKGNMQITGQIGNVMQESAQAALSYLKSRSSQFGIDPEVYENLDIHIHIPEGAIPKDGPSAGITICTALISAYTGREVRKDVGMTGEITLRGHVLPVGGIREKVLSAHRSGLKTVILPKRNAKDLIDVPKRARSELQLVLVDHIDQVLEVALRPPKSDTSHQKRVVRKSKTNSEKVVVEASLNPDTDKS